MSIINHYKIITDDNGYIISFYKVTDGEFDFIGQMSDYPDACEGWTKFENGEFIEDLEKKEEILTYNSNQNEILELKSNLNSTDYIMSEMLEEIMSLDNSLTFVVDMIRIFAKYATRYKDTLANRKTWRARIKELEESSE